jgi:hypothetical protein
VCALEVQFVEKYEARDPLWARAWQQESNKGQVVG